MLTCPRPFVHEKYAIWCVGHNGWTTDTPDFPSVYTPSFSHFHGHLSHRTAPSLLRSDLVQVLKALPSLSFLALGLVYSIMPSNNYSVFQNVLLNYCCLYVITTAWIVIFRCDYILYIWWGIDIYCNALVHTTKKGFVIWPCVCIKSGMINYCMTHTLWSETSDM